MKKFDGRKLICALLLLATVGLTYWLVGWREAAAELAVLAVLFFFFLALDLRRHSGFSAYFNGASHVLSSVLRNSLLDLHIPSIISDLNGNILWNNEEMSALEAHRELYSKNLADLMPGYNEKSLEQMLKTGYFTTLNEIDGFFCIHATKVVENKSGKEVYLFYFVDETEKATTAKLYQDTRPVVALLTLDNIEELAQNHTSGYGGIATEVSKAEAIIVRWADEMNALLRKYDNGKFLCVFDRCKLEKLKEDRFSLLNDIRSIATDRVNLTISIGIGVDGDSFEQTQEFADHAMEMALGRGGDQVAIKDKNNFEFFGGRGAAPEKRTKVKTRMLAEGLRDVISRADNVIVMGHKFADFDAIGSAVGVARIAKNCNKPVYIVCNRNTSLAMPIVERMETESEYKGVFVDAARGLDLLRVNSLVVVVDCHSATMVESSDICKNAGQIAVIDHHRKMADYIDNTVLNYHEPFASSTCELVAELVQFIDGTTNALTGKEAEALLSGVVLDTKNYSFKTGSRTFEVAAYLRRQGADTVEVKKLFQNDFESYIKKNEFIQSAEFYRDKIAISCREDAPFDDAKAVIAQAADELLSIEGAEASFVLYALNGKTTISGRSLGAINVQLILEKLGGGGHQMTAGAQVDADGETTRRLLLEAIDDYLDEPASDEA